MNEDHKQPTPTAPQPPAAPVHHQYQPPVDASLSSIKMIEKITVWVMVLSAITFALVSVLGIWGVFDEGGGDIVGKSLATLAVIAFTALVVNIGANMLEGKKK